MGLGKEGKKKTSHRLVRPSSGGKSKGALERNPKPKRFAQSGGGRGHVGGAWEEKKT